MTIIIEKRRMRLLRIRLEKSTTLGIGVRRKETREMSEMEMEERMEMMVNWEEKIPCPVS